MKTIWNAVSVVAVANLLAIAALIGWLRASDRLDIDRLRAIKEALAPTLASERETAKAEAVRAEQEAIAAAERAKVGAAPVSAQERLNLKVEQSEIDRQRLARFQKEVEDLRRSLLLERAQLERDRETLEATRAAFESERRRIAAIEGDAQFQKTLTTLEQLKPDKAKLALQQLLDGGQEDQVVAYLNGMQDRLRAKVIDEFLATDAKVAAGLLERIRMRGVEPRVSARSP